MMSSLVRLTAAVLDVAEPGHTLRGPHCTFSCRLHFDLLAS
jgi:hypothetical protein